MADHTKRDYYQRRVSGMRTERESFIPHWNELSRFNAPRRGRFSKNEINRGTKKHQNIINSAGMTALDTATSGLFAGVMSPTRPWFDLVNPDSDMMKFLPVKIWYAQVTLTMRNIFNATNLYSAAPAMIGELLNFATGCISHLDDEENVSRFHTHTIGTYMIAQDETFKTTTFAREFQLTAEQLALQFGIDELSLPVKTALDNNRLGARFDVVHFIELNDEFRIDSPWAKDKRFSSVTYEPNHHDKDAFLKKSGFDEFPVYIPRWRVTDGDIYGTDCPGMKTLGDIKQLQIMERRKAQAIDKMVNPAMGAPPSVRNVPISSLPGHLNVYDASGGQQKIESLYKVELPIAELVKDMDRVERRIDEAWYVDLFLAITNMEGIQPRNQLELSERTAERLLQLGPVLERMQGEFLDLMISRQFNQMVRADLVPDAPPEIQDSQLKVEYISSLAQAQRAVDTRGITRLTEYIVGLKAADLTDGKKLNADEAIQKFADLVGTPPTLMTPDKDIAAARQQEAQQQAMAQNLEAAETAARTAQSAGQVDLDGNNPVSRVGEILNRGRGR